MHKAGLHESEHTLKSVHSRPADVQGGYADTRRVAAKRKEKRKAEENGYMASWKF